MLYDFYRSVGIRAPSNMLIESFLCSYQSSNTQMEPTPRFSHRLSCHPTHFSIQPWPPTSLARRRYRPPLHGSILCTGRRTFLWLLNTGRERESQIFASHGRPISASSSYAAPSYIRNRGHCPLCVSVAAAVGWWCQLSCCTWFHRILKATLDKPLANLFRGKG